MGEGHFDAAVSARPIRRRRLGAGQLGTVPFGRRFELWRKKNEADNSLNAVERKPIPTRVLNPNASEASYKPKQRNYRNILKPFRPNENWAETDWAETVLGQNDQES